MMSLAMRYNPMPLVRLAEAFDHPDWLFELKHNGFRVLAHIEDHLPPGLTPRQCSRNE
jgi:hypothetical protein